MSQDSSDGARVAREAHNLEIAGSTPGAAPKLLEVEPVKKKRLTKDERKVLLAAHRKKLKTVEELKAVFPSYSKRFLTRILENPHWVQELHKKQRTRILKRYDEVVPDRLIEIAEKSESEKSVIAASKELRGYLEIGSESDARKKGGPGPSVTIFQQILDKAVQQGAVTKVAQRFPGFDSD